MIGVFWMIVLLCSALHGAVLAADDQDQDDATLVGAWRTSVLFPDGHFQFFTFSVFHREGTWTDRVSALGPATSVGSGVWKKISGRGNFAATLEGFDDMDFDGVFDRRFRVRLTIQLLDHDSFTATATIDNLTLDGATPLGPPFPGFTVQGTRMQVIPE
jgi:hypothetical protein